MKSATRRTKMLRADSLEVRVAARGGRGIAQPNLTTTTLHAPAVATGVGGESPNLFSRSLASLGRPVRTRRGRREYPVAQRVFTLDDPGQFVRDVGEESTQPALSRSYCTGDADSLEVKREGKCTT